MNAATVEAFDALLTHNLTAFDERLEAKQPNQYRLAHYLGAAQNAEKKAKASGIWKSDTPEALQQYKEFLADSFSGLPPVDNVIKQIDAFLATGKMPTISPYYKMRASSMIASELLRVAKILTS